jgi:hypothetical protein
MIRLVLTLLFGLILYLPAFSQVDTLQLNELRLIQTPDPISFVYVEELTGDNIKDFVVCTGTHIYIYNGTDFSIYWTSPYILCAGEFKFDDADGDSSNEIFCRSGQNIYIFNPPNTTPHWVSPTLSDLYRFFAVGDRNEDGFADIAMLFEEPFSRPGIGSNYDTIWVNVFNGPGFNQGNFCFFRLANFTYYNQIYQGWNEHWEIPTGIFIEKLSGAGIGASIGIFYSQENIQRFQQGVLDASLNGSVRIIQGANLNTQYSFGTGRTYSYNLAQIDSNQNLISTSDYTHWVLSSVVFDRTAYLNILTNSSRHYETIANYSGFATQWFWRGALMGDIKPQNQGPEVCYGFDYYLTLRGLTTNTQIWRNTQLDDYDTLICLMKTSAYVNPQVIVLNRRIGVYRLFDGNTGNIRAIFTVPDSPVVLVKDHNNDGNDEIITLRENNLRVYNLYRVSIDDEPSLPINFLVANNYPNPFNAQTMIEYNIPKESPVTIAVYDLLGRKITTLIDGIQPAGHHQVVWDASDYPSGVYFYKISTDDGTYAKKAILLK